MRNNAAVFISVAIIVYTLWKYTTSTDDEGGLVSAPLTKAQARQIMLQENINNATVDANLVTPHYAQPSKRDRDTSLSFAFRGEPKPIVPTSANAHSVASAPFVRASPKPYAATTGLRPY